MRELKSSKHIDVRFSEVDSMNIVWHGNYAKYFEDAREAFGAEWRIGYLDIYREGYYAPLVKLEMNYRNPMIFGDSFKVEARYVPCEAAKLIFEYEIRRLSDGVVTATGRSVQVFLDKEYKLVIYPPDFLMRWREENGVR